MNKNIYDLHGLKLEYLDQIFDKKIYYAKTNNINELKFITGTSKLQKRIIYLCNKIYNLNYYIPMNNPGEIVVIIS